MPGSFMTFLNSGAALDALPQDLFLSDMLTPFCVTHWSRLFCCRALCLHNSQCLGAVGVLKSRPHYMETILPEDTKLSLKPSRRCKNKKTLHPPHRDFSATHPKGSVNDSGKDRLLPLVLFIYLSGSQDHRPHPIS